MWMWLTSKQAPWLKPGCLLDRKSTRLNSSHVAISYAVFCLKKKRRTDRRGGNRLDQIITCQHEPVDQRTCISHTTPERINDVAWLAEIAGSSDYHRVTFLHSLFCITTYCLRSCVYLTTLVLLSC